MKWVETRKDLQGLSKCWTLFIITKDGLLGIGEPKNKTRKPKELSEKYYRRLRWYEMRNKTQAKRVALEFERLEKGGRNV